MPLDLSVLHSWLSLEKPRLINISAPAERACCCLLLWKRRDLLVWVGRDLPCLFWHLLRAGLPQEGVAALQEAGLWR